MTQMNTPTPNCFTLSCTECDARYAKLTAERDQLRAELAVAQNWVQHLSHHADDLIAENVELRAERDYLREELGC
jgi:regulator of replication initiation timing